MSTFRAPKRLTKRQEKAQIEFRELLGNLSMTPGAQEGVLDLAVKYMSARKCKIIGLRTIRMLRSRVKLLNDQINVLNQRIAKGNCSLRRLWRLHD